MTKAFFDDCSEYYDILTNQKNYEGEVKFLDAIFKKHDVKKILEVGSTTGSHTLRLASLGYDITGIDISEKMIFLSKNKIKEMKSTAKVSLDDILNPKVNELFDGAFAMYAMLSQLGSLNNTKLAIKNISKILRDGGIFIFEVPSLVISDDEKKSAVVKREKTKNDTFVAFAEEDFSRKLQKRLTRLSVMIEDGKDVQFKKTEILATDAIDLLTYEKILKKNNFEILKVYGEFDLTSSFNPRTDNNMIFVCKKINKNEPIGI